MPKNKERSVFIKQFKLALCDYDEMYIYNLMDYFNTDKDSLIYAIAFTKLEKLEEYLKQNTVDIILVNLKLNVKNLESKNIFYLSDGEKQDENNVIYKYQSANKIVKKIMTNIDIKSDFVLSFNNNQNVKIYAVYSPIGRCGKTNFSKALLQINNSKSLYLGLEEYKSCNDINGIDELFYYIKQRTNNIYIKIKSFVTNEYGFDYISSPLSYFDIRQMNEDDFKWFIEEIRKCNYYEQVVFDIGVGSLYDYSLFKYVDKIFMPVLKDEVSKNKIMSFKNIINMINLENVDLNEKIMEIEVPNVSYENPKMKMFVNQIFSRGEQL